jgi:hypothetical protein
MPRALHASACGRKRRQANDGDGTEHSRSKAELDADDAFDCADVVAGQGPRLGFGPLLADGGDLGGHGFARLALHFDGSLTGLGLRFGALPLTMKPGESFGQARRDRNRPTRPHRGVGSLGGLSRFSRSTALDLRPAPNRRRISCSRFMRETGSPSTTLCPGCGLFGSDRRVAELPLGGRGILTLLTEFAKSPPFSRAPFAGEPCDKNRISECHGVKARVICAASAAT